MLVRTEGIVIQQFPFSDTSLIVKIFTREFGLLGFIIKGIKTKKNNKANLFKPINLLSVSFYLRENQALKHINDVQLLFAPDAQNFGIFKSAISMFIVELINNTIPTDSSHPDKEKYDFINYSMQFLKDRPLNKHFYLSFMYQYSGFLGIEIPLSDLKVNSAIDNYLSLDQLALDKSERKNIFRLFEQHYFENLTNYKPLKSIDILNEILQ